MSKPMSGNNDLRCVTVNVSAASPFGNTDKRVEGMKRWASEVVADPARRPALVFAQECRDDWLDVWRGAAYRVIEGDAPDQPHYRVRSALLVDKSLGLNLRQATLADVPSLAYHGSYVAAATLDLPTGGSVLLMSLHASPREAGPFRAAWPSEVPPPRVRSTGQEADDWGGIWDADAVLATVRHCVGQHRERLILAAGDLNEALGWDDIHDGTDGADYFSAVRAVPLTSVLHERWSGEQPTRRLDGGAGLQLDHILASPDLADGISDPHIDGGWSSATDQDNWSDHAPVWFTLAVP